MHKCDLSALKNYLLDLKIPKVSTIIIHSSLFSFGIINGGINSFMDMLNQVFNEDYTIVVPTFTFKFASDRIWDYKNTKSETGILSETIRKSNSAVRSIHPFHSVAAYGPHADYLTNDICKSSFGEFSSFEKLYKLNAYNLSLGSEFVGGATFCHYAEELLSVPYRFYKDFPGEVNNVNNHLIDKTFNMFVRIVEKDYEYINRWDILWDDLIEKKLVNYHKFNGQSPVFLMNIVDSHDFLYDKILKNPYYVAEKIKR